MIPIRSPPRLVDKERKIAANANAMATDHEDGSIPISAGHITTATIAIRIAGPVDAQDRAMRKPNPAWTQTSPRPASRISSTEGPRSAVGTARSRPLRGPYNSQ